MSDITEFTHLDTEEMHLVGAAANGFDALLAKAREALEETVTEKHVTPCDDDGCPVCADAMGKGKLRAKERNSLSASDFAFPDQRKEPLHDEAHVRNAMSRFSQVEGVTAAERKTAAHKIIARAKALGIDVSEDSDVAQAAKQTAPGKEVPEGEAESQTRDNVEGDGRMSDTDNEDRGGARTVAFPHGSTGDGQGDTAPDKALPVSEALGQTEGLAAAQTAKAEGDGTGDTAPDKDLHEGEAESQTRGDVEGNTAKNAGKVPPADKKVTATLLRLKADLEEAIAAQEADNEGWESGETQSDVRDGKHDATKGRPISAKTEGAIRRFTQAATDLLDETSTTKSTEDEINMNKEELLALLDERDTAKSEADAKKAKKKAEKAQGKAAKVEGKAAKAAEKAAKAAGADNGADPNPELAELRKAHEEVTERLAKMEAEDGHRPFVNAAGVTAILRGGGEGATNVLKGLEDRVEAARAAVAKAEQTGSDFEKQRARSDFDLAKRSVLMSKMVMAENARAQGRLPKGSRFGPNSVDLFGGTTLTMPPDVSVRDI